MLQVPLQQTLVNFLFWGAIIAAKASFDYFAVIQPLREPMQALWARNWLRSRFTINRCEQEPECMKLAEGQSA